MQHACGCMCMTGVSWVASGAAAGMRCERPERRKRQTSQVGGMHCHWKVDALSQTLVSQLRGSETVITHGSDAVASSQTVLRRVATSPAQERKYNAGSRCSAHRR